MTRRIAVLGCGYVGLELCRQLSTDHEVIGVRRSDEGLDAVAAAGGEAVRADLTVSADLSAVPDVDALVFAASSGGRGPDAARSIYVDGQATAIDHFAGRDDPPEQYVYTSSTGVYGDHGGDWVDEDTPLDPQTEKTGVLAQAERVAIDRAGAAGMDATVARLAGLYGPGRYRLERYVEGPVTEGYLNMVHRDDAAGAVGHVLASGCEHDVLLVVDDEPAGKWDVADWLADACGTEPPAKRTIEERLGSGDLSEAARRRLRTQKRCRNDRLRALGYELRYPTFGQGYRDAIDAYRAERTGTGPESG